MKEVEKSTNSSLVYEQEEKLESFQNEAVYPGFARENVTEGDLAVGQGEESQGLKKSELFLALSNIGFSLVL